MCGCRDGWGGGAGFNDYVENWTAANANWAYDGDQDFTLFPGYLAAKVAAASTQANFTPLARSFSPYPRPVTGAFPIHFKHRIRSLCVVGGNVALATSYMLSDNLIFATDWVGMIFSWQNGLAQYEIEIDWQKNGVSGSDIYNTGIGISADREDDFEFIITPDSWTFLFNGIPRLYGGGFNFPQIAYNDIGVQKTAANRQGLIGRTEIFVPG